MRNTKFVIKHRDQSVCKIESCVERNNSVQLRRILTNIYIYYIDHRIFINESLSKHSIFFFFLNDRHFIQSIELKKKTTTNQIYLIFLYLTNFFSLENAINRNSNEEAIKINTYI